MDIISYRPGNLSLHSTPENILKGSLVRQMGGKVNCYRKDPTCYKWRLREYKPLHIGMAIIITCKTWEPKDQAHSAGKLVRP